MIISWVNKLSKYNIYEFIDITGKVESQALCSDFREQSWNKFTYGIAPN